MHIFHLGCFTTSVIKKLPGVSSTTTAAASLGSIRFFSSPVKRRKISLRTSSKRFMSSDRDMRNFPEVISAAISSLNTNVAPFMSAELRKLYGGVPDEDLIKNQVDNYYLPMFSYLKLLLDMKTEANTPGPLFIGISAPQGCGKTTMTDMIRAVFAEEGKRAVALSLDDFYLTGREQEQLAATEKTNDKPNELLKLRGNAGTHDLTLLNNTMSELKAAKTDLRLPRYDKSLRSGKGDRAPIDSWDLVNDDVGGNVDIVLFEGWMLGFDPLDTVMNGDMTAVNKYLQHPGYGDLHSVFDAWIVVALKDINYVFDWRLDAEKRMIKSGKPGMSDDDVRDFVNRFMPAYRTYLPRLHQVGIGPQPRKPWLFSDAGSKVDILKNLAPTVTTDISVPAPVLKVSIDQKRLPIDVSLL